jgi:organic radical activating enzyme
MHLNPSNTIVPIYNKLNSIRKLLHLKPILVYFEVHLSDHCNLNCKGCSHFSPFSDVVFADPAQYRKDLRRMSTLFYNVKFIRFLGGEPLLHPDIKLFMSLTRTYFPRSDIHIVTNGILLPAMSESFWESCRKNSVKIDLTIYPPFFKKGKKWTQLVKSKKVRIDSRKVTIFNDLIYLKGKLQQVQSFRRCRLNTYCPFLRNGRIYICAVPALIHYYNKKHGTNLPNKGYVNIHEPQVTGWAVLKKMNTSAEICKYCTNGFTSPPSFLWEQDSKTPHM